MASSEPCWWARLGHALAQFMASPTRWARWRQRLLLLDSPIFSKSVVLGSTGSGVGKGAHTPLVRRRRLEPRAVGQVPKHKTDHSQVDDIALEPVIVSPRAVRSRKDKGCSNYRPWLVLGHPASGPSLSSPLVGWTEDAAALVASRTRWNEQGEGRRTDRGQCST